MCEREKGARATVPHKGVCARKMLQVTGITKLLEEISFYGVGNIFKYKSIFLFCVQIHSRAKCYQRWEHVC